MMKGTKGTKGTEGTEGTNVTSVPFVPSVAFQESVIPSPAFPLFACSKKPSRSSPFSSSFPCSRGGHSRFWRIWEHLLISVFSQQVLWKNAQRSAAQEYMQTCLERSCRVRSCGRYSGSKRLLHFLAADIFHSFRRRESYREIMERLLWIKARIALLCSLRLSAYRLGYNALFLLLSHRNYLNHARARKHGSYGTAC